MYPCRLYNIYPQQFPSVSPPSDRSELRWLINSYQTAFIKLYSSLQSKYTWTPAELNNRLTSYTHYRWRTPELFVVQQPVLLGLCLQLWELRKQNSYDWNLQSPDICWWDFTQSTYNLTKWKCLVCCLQNLEWYYIGLEWGFEGCETTVSMPNTEVSLLL